MPVNQSAEGRSVYVSDSLEEHDERVKYPLYLSVREMIAEALPDKKGVVIDLGCGDLLATGPLIQEGYNVIGLELDPTAIRKAKEFYPSANIFLADINAIPLALEADTPKVIVMLDILEHLPWEDAVKVLKELRSRMGNHKLIVSMPNVTPYSVCTIMEAAEVAINGGRPEMGLFDRTHRILTDIPGHHKLFSEGGYKVEKQYINSRDEGVSGEWEWEKQTSSDKPQLLLRAYRLLARKLAPTLASRVKGMPRDEAEELCAGYQGLYLLEAQP